MFALLKLIQKFFSDELKLPLIPKVALSANIKIFFSDCQHEMMNYLSTPKIIFLAMSLSKLHEPAL